MKLLEVFNLVNSIDIDFHYNNINNIVKTLNAEKKKGNINVMIKDITDKINAEKDRGRKESEKPERKKDIVKIIDESEKFEDELDKNVRDITLNMDGFERFHLEHYQKQVEQYKRFLEEYLKEAKGSMADYGYAAEEAKSSRNFEWGQEIINHSKIRDLARRMQMNAVLGGNHNQVTSEERNDYEFWKYASKFNLMMSFILYDTIGA